MSRLKNNHLDINGKKGKKRYISIILLFLIILVFGTSVTYGKDIYKVVSENVIEVLNLRKLSSPIIIGGSNEWTRERTIKVEKDAKLENNLVYYEYCLSEEKDTKKCKWIKIGTRNINITDTGIHYITFRAVDSKEKRSDNSNTEIVYIDNNNPVINDIKINDITPNNVSIEVDAIDNHSGIKKYLYSLDGINYEEGESTYTYSNLEEEKEYTIYIQVEDNLGNSTILSMQVITGKKEVEKPISTPTPTKKPEKVNEVDKNKQEDDKKVPTESPEPTPIPTSEPTPIPTPEPTPIPTPEPEIPVLPIPPKDEEIEVPKINLDQLPIKFREEENYELPSYVSFGSDTGTYECLIDGDKYENTKTLVEGQYKVVCTATSSKNVKVIVEKEIDVKSKWDYITGQAVTAIDGSKWHVLENSLATSDVVVLLSDYGINENGTYNTECIEDQTYRGNYYMCSTREFDADETSIYDENDSNNIGYFIKNTYAPLVQSALPGTTNITLPTIEQILEADGQVYDGDPYYYLSSDWLLTNQYWLKSALYDNANHMINTYFKEISATSSSSYSSNIARPVITTLKTNLTEDYKPEVYDSSKSFKIGDAVTTIDGTKWHVLEASSSGNDTVVLLSDYNLNADGTYNKTCLRGLNTGCQFNYVAFDKDGTNIYDETDENNIGYFIKNKYEPLVLETLPGTTNVTIPTAEQIGNALGIDYTVWYYQPISWINATPYWTKTPSATQSQYAWKVDGGSTTTPYMWTASTTSNYAWGARPVITTNKSNIIKFEMPVGTAKNTSEVDIGDYIYMKPTATSYRIYPSDTGYSYYQTINPSELDLWRVIKKNDDGSIDVVSQYVSSTDISFSGMIGYAKFVSTLQNIAASYTNSEYVLATRHVGYNGQTGTLSNTIFMSENPPLWTKTTSDNTNESLGGGDTLYENDVNLINSALGKLRATDTNNRSQERNYWFASRSFVYKNSNNWYYTGNCTFYNKVIDYNKISNSNGMYIYINNSFNSNKSPSNRVRPILTLKPNLEFVSGDGKAPNTPYSFE